jgi:hypothetical protein
MMPRVFTVTRPTQGARGTISLNTEDCVALLATVSSRRHGLEVLVLCLAAMSVLATVIS